MNEFIEKRMPHLQGYKHEVTILLRILRKHGSVNQDHFDDIFTGGCFFYPPRQVTLASGEVLMKEPRGRFRAQHMEDYMLTFNENRDKEWAVYVQIVQMMVGTKVVGVTKVDDKIVYSWTDACAEVLEHVSPTNVDAP